MRRNLVNSWMTTYSGKRFYPFKPNVENIDVVDIAHSLALLNRFGGHSIWPFNVGQHSILVSLYIEDDVELQLASLFHDSSESIVQDLIRPVKHHPKIYSVYSPLEEKIMKAFAKRFKFKWDNYTKKKVKEIDKLVVATEMRDLMRMPTDYEFKKPCLDINLRRCVWGWRKTKKEFIKRYNELMNAK